MSSDPNAWVVPDSERPALAARYGPVLTGADVARELARRPLFAACGDRVTAEAIALGHLPLVGIVDLKTRRNEPVDRAAFAPLAVRHSLRVVNPAGVLTDALWNAVHAMVAGDGGLIEVVGEEDLGALALVDAMPLGATVIYGIPGAGVSFVTVDAPAKANVQRLLGRMERRKVDLGAHDH